MYICNVTLTQVAASASSRPSYAQLSVVHAHGLRRF